MAKKEAEPPDYAMLNAHLSLSPSDRAGVVTEPLGRSPVSVPLREAQERLPAVYVPILQTVYGLSCNSTTLALVASIATVGGAVQAAITLSTPPPEPDCAPFLPGRSARDRLTCRQQAIVFQQPETLLPALELVGHWPVHHPLFHEGQGLLEQWSQTLLQEAKNYQAEGDLPAAIALVRPIPPTSPHFTNAQTLLQELDQAQQAAAAELYAEAHRALQQQAWAEAFQALWRLQDLERAALQPGLAPQLARQLEAERQAQRQLNQARQRHALGTLTTHAEAIALASQIDPNTYLWQTAQPLLDHWCDEAFPRARQRFEQGDQAGAIAVVQAIGQNPHRRGLAQDWLILAQARQLAQLSLAPDLPPRWTPVGLGPAMLATHGLPPNSPWQAPAIAQRHRWSHALALTTSAFGSPAPGAAVPVPGATLRSPLKSLALQLGQQALSALQPEKHYQPTFGLRSADVAGRHL